MTNTPNIGPWQQGKGTKGYNNWGNDGPPSSPADGDDNNATTSNNWGDATAVGNDGGNTDTGTSTVIPPVSNAPNHGNDATADNANYKDAAGKKTLVTAVASNLVALVATVLLAAFVYGRRCH